MAANETEAQRFKIAGIILSKIIVIVAVIELIVMAILSEYLHNLTPVYEALVDSLLLSTLSSPFIYFWIIKPYVDSCLTAEKELSRMAYHDHLTRLPNRRLLSDYLGKCLSVCRRYNAQGALLLLDLNDFKEINDTYGHLAGDEVLKEIARRLTAVIRKEDIACRLGGDEFIVAMHPQENTEEQARSNASTVAKKFHTMLKEPVTYNNQQLRIHASIGICLLNSKTPDIDDILNDADNAMYQAKQNQTSKHSHVFFDDLYSA